ncbi:MAG: transglutaminase domain-containing protein [Elusimicrobia bacterium]|nr:transglutaminase domain-containing protein [Elusimicrobiota bacterium]
MAAESGSFPAGLLGAAVVFWGQQSGLPLLGATLAAALEGHRLLGRRWELTPAHFVRISDVSAVVLLGIAVYAFATTDPSQASRRLSVLLPLVYSPLALAQVYSSEGRVALSALFVFLRKGKHEWSRASVDLLPPFFLLCGLSAAAANVRTPAFYAGTSILAGWALWRLKPAWTPRAAWLGLLLLAGAAGYAGHLALSRLQERVERAAAALFVGDGGEEADPQRALTAMGHVGTLKQSDAVRLRVTGLEGPPPALLRLASFDRYAALQWRATGGELRLVPEGVPRASWTLGAEPRGAGRIEVSLRLAEGAGVLPLPSGAARLERLAALSLFRNRFGTVRAEDAPGLVSFQAVFGPSSGGEGLPGPEDLRVPDLYAPLFSGLARQLRLDRSDPRGAMASVSRYFSEGFAYSVYREGGGSFDPLREFLLRTRTGHCEHFATATVLLLRAAGIPARYATGYSIQEFSALENAYVARGRHAHAWALVRAGGSWVDLDTTPPSWGEQESGRASRLRPLADLFSWASYRAARWWWSRGGPPGEGWVAVLAALLAALAWRIVRDFAAPRLRSERPPAPPRWPGRDSELYRVERALAARGLGRRDWEPVSVWAERVLAQPGLGLPAESLREAAVLHGRHRYDPKGLDPAGREALRAAARRCLDALG